MKIQATTVKGYLAALPPDRRRSIETVRKVVLANLDPAFEEGMQYGMIGYYLPHSAYPAGYHCDPKQPLPFASLAAQSGHLALYMFCLYVGSAHDAWFRRAWTATGRRLDMGKACVRFKTADDVPLDVVAQLLRRMTAREFVATYEATLAATRRGRPGTQRSAAAKAGRAKPAAKNAPARKPAAAKAARSRGAARRGTG